MTLLHLKEPLDLYHQRRADEHGYIYFLVREFLLRDKDKLPRRIGGRMLRNVCEARSLATGVVCTLSHEFLELVEDAEKTQL
jgi:hypothetical protein